MVKLEVGLIGLILGFVPPIFFFILFWWGSIPFVSERHIFLYALIGFTLGIIIDVGYLKSWVKRAYQLPKWQLLVIYFFYMIGIFGFFMGVPVFNIFPGIVAGIYEARRAQTQKYKIHLFNAVTLFPFLLASAVLALTDQSTAHNLQGMFGLPFTPTYIHILIIIFSGGLGLLLLQILLTTAFANRVEARGSYSKNCSPS